MSVKFLPSGREAEAGGTLLDAAERAGILLEGICGGRGTCGRCRVEILKGGPPPDTAERGLLREDELNRGYRLACRVKAEGDMEVQTPEHSFRKKGISRLPEDFIPAPDIKKYPVNVSKATLENQGGDLERVLEGAGIAGYRADYRILGGIHGLLEKTGGRITAVTRGGRVIGLEAGDTSNAVYGLAFDIGTTTVVGVLCDLITGVPAATAARTNPQSVFGADVISRIHYSAQSREHLRTMQRKIISCLNDILGEFSAELGLAPDNVYDVAVAGNTTMSHLFLGVDPEQLARAPFSPAFTSAMAVEACELGLEVNQRARVYLMPNIAGHVGSDITAMLLASGIASLPGASLAIDIGTNGEIILAKDGGMVTCSTAAGPAFEGAAIFQGMRAANGAIEGVAINGGEVMLTVIGGAKPTGLCGSGLIDAIAQLLEAGLLDRKGRLMDRAAAVAKGHSLAERLNDGGSEFVLYRDVTGRKIVLTQKDIREVQLAKGAIAAGAKILMDYMGVETPERVMIAGAFGSYIKTESALRIGLLPGAKSISSIGNAAGTGVCMALLSPAERRRAEREAAMVRHIELAAHPNFQREHLKAMYFPEVLWT